MGIRIVIRDKETELLLAEAAETAKSQAQAQAAEAGLDWTAFDEEEMEALAPKNVIHENDIVLTDFTVYNYNRRLDRIGGQNEYLSRDILGLELFGKVNPYDKSKEILQINTLSAWVKQNAHNKDTYRYICVELTDNLDRVYDTIEIPQGFVVKYKESFGVKDGAVEFYVFIREFNAEEFAAKKAVTDLVFLNAPVTDADNKNYASIVKVINDISKINLDLFVTNPKLIAKLIPNPEQAVKLLKQVINFGIQGSKNGARVLLTPVLECIRYFEGKSRKDDDSIIENYKQNMQYEFTDYIYDQTKGDAAKIKMGSQTGDSNGCGWVATYNLLHYLGNPKTAVFIVDVFELQNGTMSSLNDAANPLTIADFIDTSGYTSKLNWFPDSMDSLMKNCDTQSGILIYINDTDIATLNAHYVFAHYNSNDALFHLYNSEGDWTASFKTTSIDEWLRNRKYVRMGLVTVNYIK